MTQADPTLREFLTSAERRVTFEDAAVKTRWGDDAVEAEGPSPMLSRIDAMQEAERQQAVTGQPMAEDQVTVVGLHQGMEGKTIRIFDDRLGYDAGRDMLVTTLSLDFNQNRTTFGGYVRI